MNRQALTTAMKASISDVPETALVDVPSGGDGSGKVVIHLDVQTMASRIGFSARVND